jgi:hypothetical protein
LISTRPGGVVFTPMTGAAHTFCPGSRRAPKATTLAPTLWPLGEFPPPIDLAAMTDVSFTVVLVLVGALWRNARLQAKGTVSGGHHRCTSTNWWDNFHTKTAL